MAAKIVLNDRNIIPNITSDDLNVHMSFGFVVRSRLGSLIALRAELENLFKGFTYPTLSSSPLFIVHWNDLNDKKKLELEKNNKNNRRR